MSLQSLDLTEFHRRFVDGLPGDSEPANFRRQVRGAAYSRVLPTPVSAPRLLAWSEDLAATLGLPLIPDDSAADEAEDADDAEDAGADPDIEDEA